MTQAEIYVIGLMIVLLACAYGAARWNRYVVRSHKALKLKRDLTEL